MVVRGHGRLAWLVCVFACCACGGTDPLAIKKPAASEAPAQVASGAAGEAGRAVPVGSAGRPPQVGPSAGTAPMRPPAAAGSGGGSGQQQDGCVAPASCLLCADGSCARPVCKNGQLDSWKCPEAKPTPAVCIVGGCSNHLCSTLPLGSTCEWLEEYACYRTAKCERQSSGECGWTPTPELTQCIANARTGADGGI